MELNPNIKRILFITGFVLVVILMGFAIYWVFFRAAPPEEVVIEENVNVEPGVLPDIINAPPEAENVNVAEALPEISTLALGGDTLTTALTGPEAEFGTVVGGTDELAYYDSTDGKFYRIAPDGTIIGVLTDQEFPGVENVTWDSAANAAILEFPDGSNIYYDFEKDQQFTLPNELNEFNFSPGDDQIAFKFDAINKEDNWLGVSNPDGSNAVGVQRLGENEDQVQVNWSPSGQAVGTYQDFTGLQEQKVIPIGLKGENFKAMSVQGYNFDYQWAPDGQQMVYNVHSTETDNKPSLWVVDSYGDDIGKNRIPLEVNTWADKCTFSGESTLYCGVPTSLDTGAGFVPSVADSTDDQIYKIDLNTRTKTKVANPVNENGVNDFTVENMYTSGDGNYLYFTDKRTGKIYKIQIK